MLDWAKQIIDRKRTGRDQVGRTVNRRDGADGPSVDVFATRFPELWRQVKREFKDAVSALNAGKEGPVTFQIATGESISIRKATDPCAYLDLMAHPATGTYTIRLEFYRSNWAKPVTREDIGAFQAIGDGLVIVWKGRVLKPAEFVQAMMHLFQEGL